MLTSFPEKVVTAYFSTGRRETRGRQTDSQDLAPHSREMDVNFLIFPSIFSQLLDVWEEKEVIQNQL